MIHTQNVRFSYSQKKVLKDVSFQLEKGHFLALLGNNGAGKSTLLKCFNRILEPEDGMIYVSGHEINTLKRNQIAQTLAFVAQHNDVGQMTVFDTVLLGRKPYIKINPGERDLAITQDVIERMELTDYALRYVDELSGGELQKVVIARALAQQPKVLLLDEPTSNLDLHNQHEVMRIAREIAKKDDILVIVVIHDLNLAVRYCDRFLFLKDGRVYSFGDISTVNRENILDVYGVDTRIYNLDGQKIILVQ